MREVMRGSKIVVALAVSVAVATALWADEASWTFAVISDTQGSLVGDPGVGPYLGTIAKGIAAENPPVDFVLVNGDLISGSAEHTNGQPPLADMYQTWLNDMAPVYNAGIQVYPVRGNHDTYTEPFGVPNNDKTAWLNAFSKFDYIPTNGPSGATRLIYSFQHKNALIMGLDFYIQGTSPVTIPQDWINTQFAANKLPHVFVYAHPPIVQAWMPTVLAMNNTITEADAFYDSLVNAGCKIYFAGHDHFHNRAVLNRNGKRLCQYISGTGGGRHYPWYYEGFSTSGVCEKCDITAQLACYNTDYFGYTLVTVSSDSSFGTEWKVLANGLNEPITWATLDQFDYGYDKFSTLGMKSSLYIGAAGEQPKASSGYKITATGTYTDPMKGNTKSLKKETLKSSAIPEYFDYQWLDKITLFNKKQWDSTNTAAENLALHPINPVECDMSVTANGASSSDEIAYYPPVLTSAVDSQGNQTYTINTNDKFKLFGWYFGSKAPSVYLEYEKSGKVAALSLKVDKSSYAFADVKGKEKNSCMDVKTGNSALVLITPKSWPKGWDTTAPHNIVIDNGTGRATMPFCISTPSPY